MSFVTVGTGQYRKEYTAKYRFVLSRFNLYYLATYWCSLIGTGRKKNGSDASFEIWHDTGLFLVWNRSSC